MILSDRFREFVTGLEKIYSHGEATQIVAMLFEKIAGTTRSQMLVNGHNIPAADVATMLDHSYAALLRYEPIQYILGEAWFYGLRFTVTQAVLIPRPETEELVLKVIEYLQAQSQPTVLDIGTGSGCIAISIQKNIPSAKLTAIDSSPEALIIARENASALVASVSCVPLDFLDEQQWNQLGIFQAIVSNPPYIPESEKDYLDKNVTGYEPHRALFVPNESPLVFYEKIAAFGLKHLEANGKIFMETHENFARETASLFTNEHYLCSIEKDMQGKERILIATRRSP